MSAMVWQGFLSGILSWQGFLAGISIVAGFFDIDIAGVCYRDLFLHEKGYLLVFNSDYKSFWR